MIYSSWQPDTGKYAYIQCPDRRGLGDDMPVPKLTAIGGIAAPSTIAGRTPCSGKIVGYGSKPKGAITPINRSGLSLSGVDFTDPSTILLCLVFGLTGYIVGVNSKG